MYKIVRFYFQKDTASVVKRGLTLEEAQAHCSDKETSSRTCTTKVGKARTKKYGEWFEGFRKE